MRLRPRAVAELERSGVSLEHGATPRALRERLNDVYLEQLRALRSSRAAGEIPAAAYADAVRELRDRFPLLGLPLALWEE